jgi:hypothetical protein
MGCRCAREYDYGAGIGAGINMNTDQTWVSHRLPLVLMENYENEAERLLFKTINLIRYDPQWAIPFIMKVKDHPKYTGADINQVIRRL